jgi:hypothetical protein
MMSWVSLEVVRAEHEIKVREAREARMGSLVKQSQGSPSVLKSVMMFFNRA